MHYYKRNIGDYHKKAGRLSILQHGAYCLLLDACYDRERFPDMDEAIDWCWASTPDEIEAVKFVLVKLFTLEDGRYVQNRINEELEEYHGLCQANKINGNKGGRPKGSKNKQIKTHSVSKRTQPVLKKTQINPTVTEKNPTVTLTTNQEPLTTNQEPLTIKDNKDLSGKPDDSLSQVFDHWRLVMNKNSSAKLTKERKNKIQSRLKEGYTVDQLKQAIDGCSKTAHNMGQNDNGKRYDCISLICRDGSHVERFAGNSAPSISTQYSATTLHNINVMQNVELD